MQATSVTNRLFFTFVSRKTTEKKVMKFVKDNEKILEKIGTSIVKEEVLPSCYKEILKQISEHSASISHQQLQDNEDSLREETEKNQIFKVRIK